MSDLKPQCFYLMFIIYEIVESGTRGKVCFSMSLLACFCKISIWGRIEKAALMTLTYIKSE